MSGLRDQLARQAQEQAARARKERAELLERARGLSRLIAEMEMVQEGLGIVTRPAEDENELQFPHRSQR